MIDILYTRLLLWKKKIISMLFWLLLPIIGTYGFITIANTIQEDASVPIGIVLEEESELAQELVNSLEASDLVHVSTYSESEAIYELEKHNLDSVFIIKEGYEESIYNGKRNQVVTSYRTELSFAYTPVKEMVVSLIQEESGHAKAAQFITNMNRDYGVTSQPKREDILAKIEQVQLEENLLTTSFNYANSPKQETPSLLTWDTWSVWAVLAVLSSLFLFDWVIRERSLAVTTRYNFMGMSKFNYYASILILYFLLFFLFDILAVLIFVIFLSESFTLYSFFSLITFRFMLTLLAYCIANLFKKNQVYYGFSLVISFILAIINGAIIPIQGTTSDHRLVEIINPLRAFISGGITIWWTFISLLLVVIVLYRKENSNA